jgi:cytochrome c peroxidase
MRSLRATLIGATLAATSLAWPAAAAAPAEPPFYSDSFARTPSAAALAAIGRELFVDKSLSASGKVACATCHDPAHAFGPPNGRPVQRAGADGLRYGVRAVPSLMYAQTAPPFTEHFFDDDGDDSIDQGPAGGRTWDGRAESAHDQARLPLLSPFEMANADAAAVAARLRQSRCADELRAAFGARALDDPASAFKAALMSLETYQESPEEFHPYSSRYDAWLRHEGSLSEAELRGLAAFNDPLRGNCARCHPSGVRNGAFPPFTDFGYAALGAPRNPAIPANRDPRYHDLGLCGPLRSDLRDRKEYCGLFRTPTLRNVATRRAFFHNGVFHTLTDVVRFYAGRDTSPGRWYARGGDGMVLKFDDLPAAYRGNVDRLPPLDREAGGNPALSEADVQDIVAFLNALTDGPRN